MRITKVIWSRLRSMLVPGAIVLAVAPLFLNPGPYGPSVSEQASVTPRLAGPCESAAQQSWAGRPAWMPDGKGLFYIRIEGNSNAQVYTVNADGTNIQQVTHDQHRYGSVTVSPDGKQLALESGMEPPDSEANLWTQD